MVMDVRDGSPTFGQVITTLPVGQKSTVPHHTEHELDASGELFANGFSSQHTFVFDLNEPEKPRLLTTFKPPAPFQRPHSYARLPDGNLLMTLQEQGAGEEVLPGGLIEVTPRGEVVKTVDARDDKVDKRILPYSLAVVPSLNRVVTTSADMHERWVSQAVQVWNLPDLKLVRSIQLPPGPKGREGWDPAEPRLLADGKTVLVSTFSCGLYQMTGLDSHAPFARFVYSFGGGGCALPVVMGNYWVQTVPDDHALVVLDITDSLKPREVSRLVLGRGVQAALDFRRAGRQPDRDDRLRPAGHAVFDRSRHRKAERRRKLPRPGHRTAGRQLQSQGVAARFERQRRAAWRGFQPAATGNRGWRRAAARRHFRAAIGPQALEWRQCKTKPMYLPVCARSAGPTMPSWFGLPAPAAWPG